MTEADYKKVLFKKRGPVQKEVITVPGEKWEGEGQKQLSESR